MKILYGITGIQKAAGTSVFCGAILNQLVKSGHDCRLLVSEHTKDVYPVDERVKLVYGSLPAALGEAWKPDIVHIHGIWTPLLHRVHVWARKNQVKIVFSPHGMLAPWAMAHKRWKKLLPWYLYQRTDVARSTLVHTTSKQETEDVRNLGFTNDIVEVALGTNLPPKLATHEGVEKTILFVGRIYPVKGLDLLIQAWAKIKNFARERGWQAVLVGPDQAGYMQKLKLLCADVGLRVGEDVVFTGPLYGAEKDKAYLNARALILPSYTENFGGVVVDALSFGVPVLTSNATPWNFLEGVGCGFHFELRPDAVAQALHQMMALTDEQRAEMGRRGRQLVEEKYAWPAIAEKMRLSYQGLLGK